MKTGQLHDQLAELKTLQSSKYIFDRNVENSSNKQNSTDMTKYIQMQTLNLVARYYIGLIRVDASYSPLYFYVMLRVKLPGSWSELQQRIQECLCVTNFLKSATL